MKTLLILASLLFAVPAWAMPLDYMTTTMDQTAQTVAFTMHFTGVPDFHDTDQYGRQADSFELFLFQQPAPNFALNDTPLSIVRGEELHWGGGLLIRNPTLGADLLHDPHGGGYGSVRETDPITLAGTTLSWSSTVHGLGLASTAPFGYSFITAEFGGVSGVRGHPWLGLCSSAGACRPEMIAPEPPTWMLLLAGLVALTGWFIYRDWKRVDEGP